MNFRVGGRLVGVVDSREVSDLACAGALVQSFRIPAFGLAQRAVHEHLYKPQVGILMQPANFVPVGRVGADEGGQRNRASVAKEFRDLSDTTNVFPAVRFGETEVLVDAQAHVVAVEAVRQLASPEQRALQGDGDGALAAARKAGKPDRCAFLAQDLVAVFPRYQAFLPGDIGGFLTCWCHCLLGLFRRCRFAGSPVGPWRPAAKTSVALDYVACACSPWAAA